MRINKKQARTLANLIEMGHVLDFIKSHSAEYSAFLAENNVRQKKVRKVRKARRKARDSIPNQDKN